MRATVDTRVRAQEAVDDLAGTVDEVVRGAEKSITRSRRSMRAAVEERLPATQDDMKALHAEPAQDRKRLDAIEAVRRPRPAPARQAGQAEPAKAKSKAKAAKAKPKR